MSQFADLIPQKTSTNSTFSDLIPTPELKGDLGHQSAAGLLAFGQGGMPIFDEAGAGAGALLEKAGLGDLTGGSAAPDNSNLGDIYDKRLQNIRDVEKSFANQHPVIDPALRIAGGVASLAAAPESIAGFTAANPVKSAAAYGAAQGFTGNEGGSLNRSVGAGVGAGLGVGGVYAAKVAAPSISEFLSSESSLPRNIDPETLQKVSGLGSNEISTILKNLENGDVSPQQFAAALRNSTTNDFAGELGGEPLRMLAQNQAKIGGAALQPAREAMRERLATAPQRATEIVNNALGSPDETGLDLAALNVAKGAEDTLYGAAKDQLVPRKDFLDVINTPAGQKAMKDTVERLANKGINPTDAGIVIDPKNGFHGLASEVPVDTMHQVSKSVGDLVQRNPITGKAETAAGGDIENLRKQIVDALRNNSLEFNAAQDNAAQVRQADNSLSLGRKLAKQVTGENADDTMGVMLRNEDVTPYSVAGFKQGLTDTFQNSPLGTGNPIAGIAKARTVNRTAQLVGPEKATQLEKDMIAEKLRMEFANRGLQGSNTPELFGQIMPEIPTSVSGAAGKVIGKIGDAINAGSNKKLAQAMFATSPQDKAALAAAVMKTVGTDTSYTPVQQQAIANYLRTQGAFLPTQTYGALAGAQQ